MTEHFQNSLFGYSKQSVHLYISQMNEEFSQKLTAKEKEHHDAVQGLKEELEHLREENEQLKAARREVAESLIDAKAFAAELKKKVEESDREQRAKNEDIHRAELNRLQDLAEHIDGLRTEIQSLLSNMDEELEQYALLCKTLHTENAENLLTHRERTLHEPIGE